MTPEDVLYLLDVRTWARATLLQVARVREAWVEHLLRPDEVNEAHQEALGNDVHFLLNATNHLIDAMKSRNTAGLTRLPTRFESAVTRLRTMREHWQTHRSGFQNTGAMSPQGERFRQAFPEGHPWSVSGNLAPGEDMKITVAGVLPLNDLERCVTQLVGEIAERFNRPAD